MKLIVISGTKWIEAHPKSRRPAIMRMIFRLAADNHYDIAVQGQHWPK
jgi:hypothetical protein